MQLVSQRFGLLGQRLGLVLEFANRTRCTRLGNDIFRRIFIQPADQSMRVEQFHHRPSIGQLTAG